MAQIRPFRAFYYNRELAEDLAAVICPPYDIITNRMQEELYRRSPYNFIRIENNSQLPQDSETDNRYTRSAAMLERWLNQRVLVEDDKAAIYVHDHYFTSQGKEYKRRGLIVRVRLEDWHKNIVRPHEGTLAGAKKDRVTLLGALKANTSPIMTMYEDDNKEISSILEEQQPGQVLFSLKGEGGERHEVWRISRPEAVEKICKSFEEKPLYIADGHHRYESALNYRNEQKAASARTTGEEPFNFVMMTLMDFNDSGLLILPPHRLLRGLTPAKLNTLDEKLNSFFSVERLPLDKPGVWKKVDAVMADESNISLVLFGLDKANIMLLTLRDKAAAGSMMPQFHSEIYKSLDVSVVDHVILEELLGLSSEDNVAIAYNYDRQDAIEQVSDDEYQLAFIVSPVKSKTIKAIADAGDRMPRKSTYFYPKLPSGLLLNRLV
ncbi:DUF1015 domain-containing protein [Chloroflexota bacterium]